MSSSSSSTTAKKTAAKKTASPPAAKKAPAKKTSAKTAEQLQAEVAAVGPDGKKVLLDVPDEQFEKDVKELTTTKKKQEWQY